MCDKGVSQKKSYEEMVSPSEETDNIEIMREISLMGEHLEEKLKENESAASKEFYIKLAERH